MAMTGANYSGRQPNNTAYIKTFVPGTPISLWKTINYNNKNVITPSSSKTDNLYIPGDLTVDGTITNPSDLYLKDNIEDLSEDITKSILKIRPTQFVFKSDIMKKLHYGFIAQEFEEHFPELVVSKVDKDIANLKAINYLEMIPLLVHQVQQMQKEIDELKDQLTNQTKLKQE